MVCLIERERGEGIGLNIDYSILMLDNGRDVHTRLSPPLHLPLTLKSLPGSRMGVTFDYPIAPGPGGCPTRWGKDARQGRK